jgi:hypothetical protein
MAFNPTQNGRVVNDAWYVAVGWFVGVLTFVSVWIYAIVLVGFWGGVFLGWLPALIAGFIAGFFWPVTLLLLIVIAFLAIF